MPLATYQIPRKHRAPYRETASVFPLTRISSGLAKISAVPHVRGISPSRLTGKSPSSAFTGISPAGPVTSGPSRDATYDGQTGGMNEKKLSGRG
jgi:hypothetical protein